MFERGIESNVVIDLILKGEIIERYPESTPCPSALILGHVERQTCHVVAALCRDRVKIVTVYWPDEEVWLDSRKRRCKWVLMPIIAVAVQARCEKAGMILWPGLGMR
jgi:hypothetical protein